MIQFLHTAFHSFFQIKLKQSDGQTNIDRDRVTAHLILENIILKPEQNVNVNTALNGINAGYLITRRTNVFKLDFRGAQLIKDIIIVQGITMSKNMVMVIIL